MKLGIGNDHVGYEMKLEIKAYLEEKGHEVIDFGADSAERSDYPVYGEKVARAIVSGECDAGVLICGTGVGISVSANKVHGIRAAVCSEPVTAALSKRHNNANIIAFGARIVGIEMAKAIVDAWLEAEFEGGRHAHRVGLMMDIENRP
ncbi:MAG: ribose 5-phosphate isomerase B [Lachnospiraceae bacterium]|nr:ribose 5-phosphate isomerase B [Lachnospiraceae bacterium]